MQMFFVEVITSNAALQAFELKHLMRHDNGVGINGASSSLFDSLTLIVAELCKSAWSGKETIHRGATDG